MLGPEMLMTLNRLQPDTFTMPIIVRVVCAGWKSHAASWTPPR